MARLLEGRVIADKIKDTLRRRISSLKVKPLLASIIIGESLSSQSYVNAQAKLARELGIGYQPYNLPLSTTQNGLLDFIGELNLDNSINGIILQSPLPEHVNYKKAVASIDLAKDVEGMHPGNLGKIMLGEEGILPCTPAAVMELIAESNIDLYGKEIVIVGHSRIIGRPLALLLLQKMATVTVCHIATSESGRLKEHISRAEVLVSSAGIPNLIKGDWVKEGSVVIDVGINWIKDKIVGDVEFDSAEKGPLLLRRFLEVLAL